jgi:enhancer of polycomb-like protein
MMRRSQDAAAMQLRTTTTEKDNNTNHHHTRVPPTPKQSLPATAAAIAPTTKLTPAKTPGIPPPTSHTFRVRNLDPTRRLSVRIVPTRRTRSPKGKRTAQAPPSGMEKEEEMESHLQQAMKAQHKSLSSGITAENHVIPTRPVECVEDCDYCEVYPSSNRERNKQLIDFKGSVMFFLNEAVYDADSEDEEFLERNRDISIEDFEQIVEKLETSSHLAIIQPDSAKELLQRYDPHVVDEVYGYWLDKRKKSASKMGGGIPLMPCVNTDFRKEDKNTLNPYTAFRRRAEKVQTRKKQKAEVQTYEKMLRLDLTVKKSLTLAEMIKKRERTKVALLDFNEIVFQKQCDSSDARNRLMDTISSQVRPLFQMPKVPLQRRLENGKLPNIARPKLPLYPKNKRRPTTSRRIRLPGMAPSENVVSEDWLKKNAEVWNGMVCPTTSSAVTWEASAAADAEKIMQFDVNSQVDGRYAFRRRHGCQYRAARSCSNTPTESAIEAIANEIHDVTDQKYLPNDDGGTTFLRALLPYCVMDEANRAPRIGIVRRRVGRGGRHVLDLDFDLPDFLQ